MTALQVERIAHALDQDASGWVTWTEFIAAALCVSVCRNRRLVEAAFAVIDKLGVGKAPSKGDFKEISKRFQRDFEETSKSFYMKNVKNEFRMNSE